MKEHEYKEIDKEEEDVEEDLKEPFDPKEIDTRRQNTG